MFSMLSGSGAVDAQSPRAVSDPTSPSSTGQLVPRSAAHAPAIKPRSKGVSPAADIRQQSKLSVRTRRVERPIRALTVKDMPVYAPELMAAATRSIKEARTDRVMLTYKEIDAFFGISRATVARRLKDGLVPGIRMLHGRVLEDGPVRRLDRTQLLYLLLAVRSGRS